MSESEQEKLAEVRERLDKLVPSGVNWRATVEKEKPYHDEEKFCIQVSAVHLNTKKWFISENSAGEMVYTVATLLDKVSEVTNE